MSILASVFLEEPVLCQRSPSFSFQVFNSVILHKEELLDVQKEESSPGEVQVSLKEDVELIQGTIAVSF